MNMPSLTMRNTPAFLFTETPEENEAEQEVVEISDNEEEDLSEFTSLYQGIANSQQESQSQEAQPEPVSGPEPGPGPVLTEEAPGLLEETLVRIRTLEDVEMLSQNPLHIEGDQPSPPMDQSPNMEETALPCGTQKAGKKMKRKKGIDPNEVLTKEAKMIKVPLAPTAVEDENGEEVKSVSSAGKQNLKKIGAPGLLEKLA